MHIICPHCQNAIEVADTAVQHEILCPVCGSTFRLECGSTTGWKSDQAGRRLGRFEVIDTVGSGAFGTVYMARDPELDRVVAVKVPRAGNLSSSDDLQRFLREARSVAQLHHPSIVPVHEVGQQEGVPYLVTDFVRGLTLADVLTGRRPSFREAAELVAAVADALHYAHEQGVVHRDVKPSNIMLDEHGRPRLMDFGLAKREAGEVTMTIEGQVLGTPAYMSPEQARGEAHKVDGRSDVYSLGVVLYQLLTGELPFRGNQRMLLHQVLRDDPRLPHTLNDQTPRDLETICLKAMSKEPGRRYPTARELADDLRRWQKGEPILARPTGRTERAWRWAKRKPATAALLVVTGLAVLLICGAVVGSLYSLELKRANVETLSALKREEEARTGEEAQRKEAEKFLYFHRITLAEREWLANSVRRADQLLEECPLRLRDWEWHYLKRHVHGELRTLRGHTLPVQDVSFSPDDHFVASGGNDHFVNLWDVRSGQPVRTIHSTSIVGCLAFSPDGNHLVWGNTDFDTTKPVSVTVWDVRSGTPVQELTGHFCMIGALAFRHDGQRLAAVNSGAEKNMLKVWDFPSGKERFTSPAPTGGFNSVAYSPDGRRLATGSGSFDWNIARPIPGEIQIRDAETGRVILHRPAHADAVYCVTFSPDGRYLASCSLDQTVKLWDAETLKEIRNYKGHTHWVTKVKFTPDGRRLVSASYDGSTRVWDVETAKCQFVLRGHSGPLECLSVSQDGKYAATGSRDQTVKLWNLLAEPGSRTFQADQTQVSSVIFSRDGSRLAVATLGGAMQVWDVRRGVKLQEFRGHEEGKRVWRLRWTPDEKRLISASEDKTFRVWDADSGKEIFARHADENWVQDIALSYDGGWLATGGGDRMVRVWDAATGELLWRREGHKERIRAVAFSPNAKLLASAAGDASVKLWQPQTGDLLRSLEGHSDEVAGIAFSPDGSQLASASEDGTIKVWDLTADRKPLTLEGHTHIVMEVAFSPDGRRIASASYDGAVKAWDAASGQELLTLRADAGGFRCVAFSPDGRLIAAGARDGTFRLWDASPADKGPMEIPADSHQSP